MNNTLDRAVSISLMLGVLAIGGSVVYRTFGPQSAQGKGYERAARRFDQWRSLDSAGYLIGGSASAPVRITVFSDLECPACRSFHRIVREAVDAHPGQVKLTFVSHPLSYHRFAAPGARATHCVAASGGNVSRWIDVIFEKQDSLGLKSWGSFAQEAASPDSATVARCASGVDSSSASTLREFATWSERVGVDGTPTVLINGWVLGSPPSRLQLDTLISARSERQ